MRSAFPLALALLLFQPEASPAQPNASDTRMLAMPALSAGRVAFLYGGDLWSATVEGGDVRRITSADGDEANPVFSPDGSRIAFSANYDGNVDVYVIPATGGVPARLTWHPGDDVVQAFSPDGRLILFSSERAAITARYAQLYEVSVDGGVEQRLPIPNASRAAYSPDGAKIVYNPLPSFATYPQWKRYRGGASARLWIYDRASRAATAIPQPSTGGNDTDPTWIDGTIYFRSDRDGEFNLYGYDTGSNQVRQLTRHRDFPVLSLSGDRRTRAIVYEQAGYLHRYDLASGQDRKLTIGVGADLRETRARFVRGPQYIRNAGLAPSGARAVFEYRGEIVTVPAEKGDVRNLTNTPGVTERAPAWSPDGSHIAYVSDQSGENEIKVGTQDGTGTVRSYRVEGGGYYGALSWSPDGKRIAYQDNNTSTFVLDLGTGRSVKVAGNVGVSPVELNPSTHAWSPDSKWLAYSINTQPLVQAVFLYSVEEGKSYQVTDGLAEAANPSFDQSGKYLYLFGSTDAGPLLDWFALSSQDARRTRTVYAVVLQGDLPSPAAKESDEEPRPSQPADSTSALGGSTRAGTGRIDLEGIASRMVALPIPAGTLDRLEAGPTGTIWYLREEAGVQALHRYDLNRRKDETVVPDVADYRLSPSRAKLLYRSGASWSIVPTTGPVKPDQGRIAVADIEVRIDPRLEWTAMFDDAWRINRDYFYDPKMHGVDWPAVRAKYLQFMPHLATRSDLTRVLQWMGSELVVGHHYITAFGDRLNPAARVPGGLLGADYAVSNGRYRFATIYGGLAWNPELRAPLRDPGVLVKAGEYLLAVNGQDLRPPTNLHSRFESTAGKLVTITVGPDPSGAGSRTVTVVPIADERALRHRAWVEGNLRKVDSLSHGQVAYVYVPNTADAGHVSFKRYFYPQAHKSGIVVDERYNGGGSAADYYIDILRRAPLAYWATRTGDLPSPAAAIAGPKALLINETAGSGGDFFPWMFKTLRIGPVIGKRTWGGLVGILGFPALMDGGGITAPNFAAWTPKDGWLVENVGVPPDVEVEQSPAAVAEGRDPQLEKAVEMIMAELRQHPLATPKRPPFPNKAASDR